MALAYYTTDMEKSPSMKNLKNTAYNRRIISTSCKTNSYCIGVDEVGRGPLAGPVTVAIVCVPYQQITAMIRHIERITGSRITDSKKVLKENRLTIASVFQEVCKDFGCTYAVVSVSATTIDTYGIVSAIRRATMSAFKKISCSPHDTTVILDAHLRAPQEFIHQFSIVKADENFSIASLASIIAKVTRDTHMERVSKRYPEYGFDIHKGYGTAYHRAMIRKYGITKLHRRSFLKNIIAI